MSINTKRFLLWALVIAFLLSIPLIAMQLTTEVNWDFTDFAIIAVALTGIALSYELIARKEGERVYRIAFGIGLIGAFLLFWMNAAVGIIGNEAQVANLLFSAVFATGLIGALISRFKAKGMAFTLYIAALVQMLVPTIAIIIWPPSTISWSPGVFRVFLVSAFFAILFLLSGFLFSRAASESIDVK